MIHHTPLTTTARHLDRRVPHLADLRVGRDLRYGLRRWGRAIAR